MRAITLHRPWAWSIIHGPKRIENRSWKPWKCLIGERLIIHAGQKFDAEGSNYIAKQLLLESPWLPLKAMEEGLIGVVTVDGFIERGETPPKGQHFWFFGPFGWVLKDVKPFKRAIPCKGKQGVWLVPDEVLEQCKGQL